jgi:hypothetical protein
MGEAYPFGEEAVHPSDSRGSRNGGGQAKRLACILHRCEAIESAIGA